MLSGILMFLKFVEQLQYISYKAYLVPNLHHKMIAKYFKEMKFRAGQVQSI